MPESQREVIKRLTMFCCNELAAAEGCRVARAVNMVNGYRAKLHDCEASHEARATRLGERIARMGGEPPDSPGLRHALEHTVKDTIEALSSRTTLALLEANEDERLEDYQTKTEDLDDETRRFISEDILPEQQHTHELISSLAHAHVRN
jgi:bacterioferritin (cytochrome b1)